MKKRLLTDDSSLSIENKNNSQLLSLPLPSSLLSVVPVVSKNADNDCNPSSLAEIDLILLLGVHKLRSIYIGAVGIT